MTGMFGDGCHRRIECHRRPHGSDAAPDVVEAEPGPLFFAPPMVNRAMDVMGDAESLILGRNPRAREVCVAEVARVPPIPVG